jgi:hypothetical protein
MLVEDSMIGLQLVTEMTNACQIFPETSAKYATVNQIYVL